MSMNLAFKNNKGDIIDFPYQTSTKISRAVFSCATISDKLKIITDDIAGSSDKEWSDNVLSQIEKMFNDTSLRLVII